MHDTLITYINSKLTTKLSEEDSNLLASVFKPKKFRKHQYLLQEGEVCKFAGFIVKGAFKQYTVDKTGKENILGLYIENFWVGDRESFMVGTPSPYFIDAFEDVEMLMVNREDFINKLSRQPFINEMIKVVTEKQSFNLLKRVQAAQTLTAEERYEDFEKRFPEFMQRFPQHIIASYLGMTKETLSRIRAGSIKK
ncbi:MAG: Crp/Fnr family transcriptional regulator [Saprospiraceae bacterium]|nr:Crp/Fnr family transcriptional regulator [Saprospiraceae bacterium]MBK7736717.1 Crp/Fnr family transcriptional regulator [Saprospiraceae bacterium]MBK7911920.1 Crp/Fnr family transcriptional regulator [Saprospiraceae bacterium]